MTDREVVNAIKTRLALWGDLAVYERQAVPATPPAAGYLSFAMDWGRQAARTRGGERMLMASVVVAGFELYVPRARMGDADAHLVEIEDLFRGWENDSLHFEHWRREDVNQKEGGPYYQVNAYVGMSRYEQKTATAA